MVKVPDPKLHLQISIVKSALRIIAGGLLMTHHFFGTGLFLVLAEVLGIAEELF